MAPAVIVATGARPRELGVEGEKKFKGRGISYCATCDGAYFEDKDIHVIGGGNSAVEESLFLTQFARSITIVHQFDHFQAEASIAHEALEHPKIKVIWDSEPRGFYGEKSLQRLRIENVKTHEMQELTTDGVFVFIGMVPQTEWLKGVVELDKWGYVPTDETMATSVPGLFVAGDIRVKRFRQITTAVADGTIAALAAQKYVRDRRA
jgi:thioredoxin reductase (NADPH)